jgi:hypothetical protein
MTSLGDGVVGYTYQAENLCPSCTLKALRANGITVQRGKAHEDAIRGAAKKIGIDFDDECSYDSDAFPKAVTEQMCETELTELPDGERRVISDERCTGYECGKWLALGEKSPDLGALTRRVRDEYELPQALAKKAAATLREWGLSHPEFIDAEDVKTAAAQHPHAWLSYRFVDYPTSSETEPVSTPEREDEECVHCGRPWAAHQNPTDLTGEEAPVIS